MVTRGPAQAANKSGVFAHGQNLLYALDRQRDCRRPIIFIAHSLGGILVKEMISYADASREVEFLNIIQDISAVVFLGTPHRGSGAAHVGEIARRVASALRIDTSPAMLDSLGLRNDYLVRSQQSFARIWDEQRFEVKTFQESKGPSGVNVGMLNDLIVPIESSTLGHPREHPESLDADHLNICKFKGCDDPNYRKFGAEMKKLYKRATESGFGRELQAPLHDPRKTSAQSVPVRVDFASDKALLSLAYRNMGLRERTIERPASGTCDWPLCHPDYQAWLTRSNVSEHRGLLRLIGHPGSGKSVLVKALADECASHAKCSGDHVATFFFDARGSSDQKSMLGLLKALLFQLLPMCVKTYDYFNNLHTLEVNPGGDDGDFEWHVEDLRDVFLRFCSVQRDNRIYIFIDAVDECEYVQGSDTDARSFAYFLQDLADKSYDTKSDVSICMSSRRYPTVKLRCCAEIIVDKQNRRDIDLYVSRELQQYGFVSSEMSKIKDHLTSKASGVFLWARLVLSSIAQAFDAGLSMDISSVLGYLAELPGTLLKMFGRILLTFSSQERAHALPLFQWAVLAQRPLSAEEWIHILAFVDEPEMHSIKEWREGRYGIRDMEQLAKRLRNMTGGLLEVVLQDVSQEDNHSEVASGMRPISLASVGSARAGSMEPYGPVNFVVQFMHLSACQYFLTGKGFRRLGQSSPPACFGAGHDYIASICLRYARLDEMKPLISNHSSSFAAFPGATSSSGKRLKRQRNRSDTNLSVVSFGSSAASSVRRHSLPASAPPSNSAGNAASNSLSGGTQPQLTRELLETHLDEMKPAVDFFENEPEDDAHSQSEYSEHTNSFSAHKTNAILSDDPALRLYAIEMFVHHAVAANEADAYPSNVLGTILEDQTPQGCWYKWCKLNDDDDIKSDTTPAYFAAEQNLKSWIEWYSESSVYRHLLNQRGGHMRYPLLAAIHRENISVVAWWSNHFHAEVLVKDAWMMLHYLVAGIINGNEALTARCSVHHSALARSRFSHRLTERLLILSTDVLTEDSDIALRSRLHNYTTKSCVGRAEFKNMLVSILNFTRSDDRYWYVEAARIESFLNDAFLRMHC